MKRWRRLFAATAGLSAAFVAECAHGQFRAPATSVVRSNDTAPGTGGASYFAFNSPVINASGQMAFSGFLNHGGPVNSGNDFGIWGSASGGLTLAAREGSPAPGTGGASYFSVSQPLMDSTGQIAFFGVLQGGGVDGSNAFGLWVGTPGAVQLAARTGNIAPDTLGELYDFVSESALIAAGKVAFYGSLASSVNVTGTNDDGIWAGTVGDIHLVAREGSSAPGTTANYGVFNITPVINTAGAVAFRNTISGAGVTPGVNDKGIWAGPAGGVGLVARTGDVVGPIGGGVTFQDFSTQPTISSTGSVAFQASLAGTGSITNDTAIFAGNSPGSLVLVAREGNQAGGLPAGVNYGQLPDFVVLNSNNRTAFVSLLAADITNPGAVDSTNDRAIFAGPMGSITAVARSGNDAPGTTANVKFDSFDFSVSMNTGGQVAFLANLTGAGVVTGNNRGIWAVDPFGVLSKVAREGDPINLAPGVDVTVNDVGIGMFVNSGGGEGRWTSFNDSGQLTWAGFFTDGSRAVVQSRVGGSARISASAPIFGPATTNGNNLGTPAGFGDITPVSGDIGYLRFAGAAPLGEDVTIVLDFTPSSNIAIALAELKRGETIYGYTADAHNDGAWDIRLIFADAGLGNSPSVFYWNFANLQDVDLQAVQAFPEPGMLATLLFAGTIMMRRRRT